MINHDLIVRNVALGVNVTKTNPAPTKDLSPELIIEVENFRRTYGAQAAAKFEAGLRARGVSKATPPPAQVSVTRPSEPKAQLTVRERYEKRRRDVEAVLSQFKINDSNGRNFWRNVGLMHGAEFLAAELAK